MSTEGWDHATWSREFRVASAGGDRKGLRALRRRVFADTLEHLRPAAARGEFATMREATRFYAETDSLLVEPGRRERFGTSVAVLNADFLEVARLLAFEGSQVAVLNMANRHVPGGGALDGAGAQEENLFRRSSIAHSLYQFSTIGGWHAVPPHPEGLAYPIPRESGGVYSPGVRVFRSSEASGYAHLPRSFDVAVITMPAINRPRTEPLNGGERLVSELATATRRKIRGILRIAARHEHDDIVLSAFGCGAFRNPPGHMAELFREELAAPEFSGAFRRVVFAILDDHNARGEGNYLPFLREICRPSC